MQNKCVYWEIVVDNCHEMWYDQNKTTEKGELNGKTDET